MTMKLGSALTPEQQKEVLRKFVNRYTRENIPAWTHGKKYPVQFASDADWLANTEFAVNRDGSLNSRITHCFCHPTWPDNPELLRTALLCRS